MAPVKIKNEGLRQMITGKAAIRYGRAWAFGIVENLSNPRYVLPNSFS
jgi:hypothetical protein